MPVLEQEFSPELGGEFAKYPGKWVAFTRDEIVGVGDTPEEAVAEARSAGYDAVFVLRVPTENQRNFVL